MKIRSHTVGPRLRIVLGPGVWIGPGKAELLALIKETGSISAAGRRLGMSYKRAWSLVETLNGMFASELVAAVKGGSHGGGAVLTELGEEVLARYLAMVKRTEAAVRRDLEVLRSRLSDISSRK